MDTIYFVSKTKWDCFYDIIVFILFWISYYKISRIFNEIFLDKSAFVLCTHMIIDDRKIYTCFCSVNYKLDFVK